MLNLTTIIHEITKSDDNCPNIVTTDEEKSFEQAGSTQCYERNVVLNKAILFKQFFDGALLQFKINYRSVTI